MSFVKDIKRYHQLYEKIFSGSIYSIMKQLTCMDLVTSYILLYKFQLKRKKKIYVLSQSFKKNHDYTHDPI